MAQHVKPVFQDSILIFKTAPPAKLSMQTVLLVLMQIIVLPAKTGTMLKELAVRPVRSVVQLAKMVELAKHAYKVSTLIKILVLDVIRLTLIV
jgi:hypothetical protein